MPKPKGRVNHPETVDREVGGSGIIHGETEDSVEKDATTIETVEDKIENSRKRWKRPVHTRNSREGLCDRKR